MQTKELELSDEAKEEIVNLSRETGVSRLVITQIYTGLFNDPWVQDEGSFKNDADRHRYVLLSIGTRCHDNTLFFCPHCAEFLGLSIIGRFRCGNCKQSYEHIQDHAGTRLEWR